MADATCTPESLQLINDWLARQAPEVRQGIAASVDLATGTVRDAEPGQPTSGATDCLCRLARLGRDLPSVRYFRIAHDLLDKAGEVAFGIGVAGHPTEHGLLSFLSLAGTALFGDKAGIARFEKNFRADSSLDDVVLYFQAELEMLDGGFPSD